MNEEELKKGVLEGKIFIYPTDTIYGIGCNALNKKSVGKIRAIKKRDGKPFSVIAPSFKWVKDNLVVDVVLENYLPGPFPYLKSIKRKFEPHGYDEAEEETEEEAEKIRYEGEWAWLGEQQRKDEQELEESTKWLEEQERLEEKNYWEEHDINYLREALDLEGLNKDPDEDPDEDEADEMQDLY